MAHLLARLATVAVLFGVSASAAANPIYVDDDAPVGGDGSSWATAFTHLQDALAVANSGDEIRVARGMYKPDRDEAGNVTPGDRTATFQLISGVVLKGGYAGLGLPDPDLRDIALYDTILSGDLSGNDTSVACVQDAPDCNDLGELCADGFCIIRQGNIENSYHVVTGSGTDTTGIVDGFTVTGGNATGTFPNMLGAGMHNDAGSPTVTNCRFSGNYAGNGGGMSNWNHSSPTVTNCTFTGNSCGFDGGGMQNRVNSSPTVTNCTFSGNYAGDGGGMNNRDGSSPSVTNCTFSENTAGGNGGGMYTRVSSSMHVMNCTFSANTASSGGGMFTRDSISPTVTNCTFSANTAGGNGGGMINSRTSPTVTDCTFTRNSCGFQGGGMFNFSESNPTVTHCTFSVNTATLRGGGMFNFINSNPTVTDCAFLGNMAGSEGGGMYSATASSPTVTNCAFIGNFAEFHGGGVSNVASSPIMNNCTLVGNAADRGGGVFNSIGSSPVVTNCIVWGNSFDEIFNEDSSVDTPTVRFSNVQGGLPPGTIDGGGNVSGDPLFVDADGPDDIPGTEDDDLRLRCGSPCIDVGDNTAVTESTDIAGNLRIVDGDVDTVAIVDMGAYEFGGDCNGNSIPDGCDIRDNTSLDCNSNRIPDECEPDCNRNFVADSCDIADGTSADCNNNGIPDDCEPDCDSNGIPDDCDIASDPDLDQDCGGNGIPDDCEPDCNGNSVADLCDILSGASRDCNNNTVPDSCDISNDATLDCNSNGVLDECEVLAPKILYVDAGAAPGGDGLRWQTAMSDLQLALTLGTCDVDEIRVAQGTYAPSDCDDGQCAEVHRAATFQLVSGVALYGGFAGLGMPDDPDLRDIDAYKSILTGDIARDDVLDCLDGICIPVANTGENCFHVVTGSGTAPTAILDGFSIIGGNANGTVPLNTTGAGMQNISGSPTVRNCSFRGNAAYTGGGMTNSDSRATVTNCTFVFNLGGLGGGMSNNFDPEGGGPTIDKCVFASNFGGGMVNGFSSPTVTNCMFLRNSNSRGGGMMNLFSSSPTLTNCVFSGNTAGAGGGMSNEDNCSPILTNCSFSGNISDNSAEIQGGGMMNIGYCTPVVTNCIFWGNSPDEIYNLEASAIVSFSDVRGTLPSGTIDEGGNINSDPMFVDANGPDNIAGTEDDNVRLSPGSPCIDAGDNSVVSLAIDLDGNQRKIDDPASPDCRQAPGSCGTPPIVDMGAYEFGSVPCGPADLDCDGDVDLRDFGRLQACFGAIDPLGCNPLATPDLDGNGQVDLDDHVVFLANLTGPGS